MDFCLKSFATIDNLFPSFEDKVFIKRAGDHFNQTFDQERISSKRVEFLEYFSYCKYFYF
jgi:hypothetical protein